MSLERKPRALRQWKNNLCSLAPSGPEVHLPLLECKIVQTLSVSNRKSENRIIALRSPGLNFQDLMVRQGAIDSPPKCPFILGFECAGDVEQVGEGVEDFQVGDQVVALPEYRAWAELVAVPSKYVYKLPKGLSYLDAVTITMNYTVAYILLFEIGALTQGKSVLVHSVGGGVPKLGLIKPNGSEGFFPVLR
ncbi:hypothetical protein HUJ04_004288 [Dendroctonus ponderosae]|nr:hypothetical protein HUJ04_004288 [Dendroctonus ponderosae]